MAAITAWLPRVRWKRWTLLTLAGLALLIVIVAHFLDEPIRRRIESQMNAQLKGYTVRIGRADFHPFGFSLDLEDSVITLDAAPDPPVADVPNLTASVQWLSLLQLKLVANFRFDAPKLHFNENQGRKELANETPIEERGWQEAVQEIYPLKINEFRVNNGEITYTPEGKFQPLELRNVNLLAANIRNIKSRDREYPSELHVDAVVFKDGELRIDGNADFLAEPHAGIRTDIELARLPLSYITGVVKDYATIRKGVLSGKGLVEYAPTIKQVSLEDVAITGADADYVMTAANYVESKEAKAKTIQKAKEVSNDAEVQLRAKKVRVTGSTLGWVNTTEDPDYRLYVSNLDLTVDNFSNQKKEGIGKVAAKGKFNGTGTASLDAVFRPETKSPDFDLAVKIEDTDLRNMNNLLRAKGNVDVTQGFMGFFSELTVRNNNVDGYVKVLFHDLNIYDKQQDKHKPFMKKAYEVVAEGLAKLLENRKTEDTATKASLSGPIENPNASLWEIITRLVQNAFFKAILPGLDQQGSE